ncbi:MAG: ethanolamine ammonia-lyase subunit EutB [Eubacteriales bacterium]|nr:ethanolamine ammonia-lyase subunit EutB [Eubacteriales bacterium]
MILKAKLNGEVYSFKDVKDVLAKANEPKSADRLQGIAASGETERVAAKIVLANLTIKDLVENPTVPYEKDEVTRCGIDFMNKRIYDSIKNLTIGEYRDLILDEKTNNDKIQWLNRGIDGEVAAAVAKIMSAADLVQCAQKIHKVTRCATEIGQPGTLSYRLQTNSTTDDPDEILAGIMEGLTYASGDACFGINPVEDNFDSTKRIGDKLGDFIMKEGIPTQLFVLSHITTQMESLRHGVPLSGCFSSIAGTQKALENFGINKDLLLEGYDVAAEYGMSQGPNLLYFETGQGSEVSIDADEGVDEMTLEARTYEFARYFNPCMVNNVTGFIGPETIYDGKEMIRGNLEDHFMGKLLGLPMGMAPCFTNHTPINIDDQQIAVMLVALAGSNFFMGLPMGDDIMLAYQDVSFHDDATLRQITNRKPAPAFFKWAIKRGILDEDGNLTDVAGDGSIFMD